MGLTDELRQPIIDILRWSVSWVALRECIDRLFGPYSIDRLPERNPIMLTEEERDARNYDFLPIKRVLLGCEWFQLFDLLELIFSDLDFHDTELRHHDEESQVYPLQEKLNGYFIHAGIGWQMVDGRIINRGDAAFEQTLRTAEAELKAGGRATAAERIKNAIRTRLCRVPVIQPISACRSARPAMMSSVSRSTLKGRPTMPSSSRYSLASSGGRLPRVAQVRKTLR